MANLKVSDKVMWRGTWGKDIAKETIVTHIDKWNGNNLESVTSADWDFVMSGREIVVSLSNGHWAYGFQLREIKL